MLGHNAPPPRRRLTPQMVHVLRLVAAGRSLMAPLVDGKGSQSATAGRARTIWTLQRRGLLNSDEGLTLAGLAEVERRR